ncbi:MAG: (2Fe-2S)-binding protein [Chloroflexi bacterium]|jgi:carbon-monoxide dehydrogenase small subunit|nr:(2Fe-2S)-binding protein [Chloroflexota bacterium]
MKRTVEFTVNGDAYRLDIEPNRRLIDVLRDDLGLTGTKEGCSIGVCGACTVTVNGEMVSSCLMLAVNAQGAEIVTIEGLAQGDRLHPLQQAFIEYGGFQCGICTPGQIMAAKALLDHNPHPTREEVVEWMTGNLCRCTGYYKIIDSIMAVVEGKVARAQEATT